jgi:hypothetical protein
MGGVETTLQKQQSIGFQRLRRKRLLRVPLHEAKTLPEVEYKEPPRFERDQPYLCSFFTWATRPLPPASDFDLRSETIASVEYSNRQVVRNLAGDVYRFLKML